MYIDNNLIKNFTEYVKPLLLDDTEINHEWNIEKDSCTLTFLKNSESGFDIYIKVYPDRIMVSTDRGAHEHFDVEYENSNLIECTMGFVRDLLSADMRIRELLSGNKPYKWIIENFDGEKWNYEGSTGLIFWNYFGRKSEKIYQNDILPRRMSTQIKE